MLKRYFISNMLLMVLLNLLVKPFWIFAIDRNVQNVVGYETYGLYAALLNLTIIFNILLDVGITNFNNKSIAEQPDRIKTQLPNMLVAKSLLSLVYIGIILCIAFFFKYRGIQINLLFCIAGVQLLNSFLLFLRSNISAQHNFKADSVFSVLDKLIMIAICGYLLIEPSLNFYFKIEWFVYAQLIAYSISILCALFFILKKYTGLNFNTISWFNVKELLVKSLPYAVLILLMGVYMRADSVLLERLLPKEGAYQNGIYISAFRILDALNMFGFLFAGILLPMFSRMLSKQNKVNELVRTTTNILFSISLIVVAHNIFFNEQIMNLLYDNNTPIGSSIYRFVILSFPAYCLMYVYSTLLTANGSISLLIKIALVVSILSLGLNLILIPTYKAQAVAWVAVLIHWLAAIFYIIFSIRKTSLTFQWTWAAQFVLLFILFVAFNFGVKFFNINLWLSIVLNAIVFFPFVFITKVWNWRDIAKYFQDIVVKD